ncbi:glycosyltransferase [Vibrio taketomensis]|uniref:glycosyltransferase n=1 Tax=Vibrio taketomensis TaxID=2572923 RepID=UPI0039E933E8
MDSRPVVIHRLGNSWGVLGQIFRYINLVRKVKPDFVLSFLFRSNWYNTIGSKLFGYKSLLSERGILTLDSQILYQNQKKLIKLVFNSGDVTICVSSGVGSCLVENYSLNPDKMVVLNNFYNLQDIKSITRNSDR